MVAAVADTTYPGAAAEAFAVQMPSRIRLSPKWGNASGSRRR